MARQRASRQRSRRQKGVRHRGFVGPATVRLVLLFVVVSEVCFLASRYRQRIDLTGDRLYTLTTSTQRVLNKLDDRLLIEAYFSPKSALPIFDQPKRMALVNLLEEYEKLSDGRVKVQFIDPMESKNRRETAERLGMQPQHARLRGERSVTATEIWQGMRLRYGAKKQEVIPYMPFPQQGQHPTAYYERVLTPLVKRLTVTERKKIGVLAFRSRPGGRGLAIDLSGEKKTPPQRFTYVGRLFEREYDMRPIDISKGQLIPDDINIALLIRPKHLSDRTKFVFDQFLMRGGQLVVFADTCEIEVREDRAIRNTIVPYDADASRLRSVDMMKSYGVEVRDQIVGDGASPEIQQSFFDVRQDQRTGKGFRNNLPYPYIFEAVNNDWKQLARAMAGEDKALAKQYEAMVEPGMAKDHDFVKLIANIGVGMFWPCPVVLLDKLPEGVEGEVLLRSSPASWVEAPNARLDPFDEAPQHQQRQQNLGRWAHSMALRLPSMPQQFPLMVDLHGTFPSFFADKEIPVPSHILAERAKKAKKKKVEEDWGNKDEANRPKPTPEKEGETDSDGEPEETKLTKAPESARLVVIGDATFVRDDFLACVYQQPNAAHGLQLYGPFDRPGVQGRRVPLFLRNLLDWLAEERDLQELINKTPTDRSMKFVERNTAAQETDEEFHERLAKRASIVQYANALGPMIVLFLVGVFVWLTRRAKKRAFLARM